MKALIICALLVTSFAHARSIRIKDLVSIKGVRDNPIIGYGLVIGLNGTGDSGGEITNQSLKKMFQKLGMNPQKEISSQNVAAVIVTAKLPAFGRIGQKMDIIVSSIGDASSLAGGTLLVTPMKAGDGNIYAIASGPLSIGGLKQGAKFATTGTIPGGATIERELPIVFNDKKSIRFAVKDPDFTTAARIEKIINEELGGKFAVAKDSATIDLIIPSNFQKKVVNLLALVENFKVIPDRKAKIIINERTGTIVAGGDIALKTVAISHGDLVIEVQGGGGGGKSSSVHLLKESTTINDLVKALNSIGTKPEDLISIFQALRRNGAILADIELI
jgi:flagellar P-ring protein precursor FlgI